MNRMQKVSTYFTSVTTSPRNRSSNTDQVVDIKEKHNLRLGGITISN